MFLNDEDHFSIYLVIIAVQSALAVKKYYVIPESYRNRNETDESIVTF